MKAGQPIGLLYADDAKGTFTMHSEVGELAPKPGAGFEGATVLCGGARKVGWYASNPLAWGRGLLVRSYLRAHYVLAGAVIHG